MRVTHFLAAGFVLLALRALGAPGDLDPTFGTNGRVDFTLGAQGSEARALRLAGDKALTLIQVAGSVAPRLGLVRLLADGSLDAAFGNGGKVMSSLDDSAADSGEISDARALLIQPDGKIMVGGEGRVSGARGPVVMRFAADGTADTAFGIAGRRIAVSGTSSGAVHSLIRLADGKILAAGVAVFESAGSSTTGIFVTRWTEDGSPDLAFGSSGVARVADASTGPVRLALQDDGRIVVGAMTSGIGMWARRLMADGAPDNDFGSNGRVDMAGPIDVAQAIVQADGRVALVGNSPVSVSGLCSARGTSGGRMAVGRVNSSGSAANTMAGGLLVSALRSRYPTIRGALLDRQDRMVLVGSQLSCGATFTTVDNPILVRFTPAGALDTAFGADGVASLAPIATTGYGMSARDVALTEDGRMVAVADRDFFTPMFSVFRVLGGDSVAIASAIGDVDNDAAPDAVESGDPFIRDNDIFRDARLFAMQQYRDFLGREGDSGGIEFWTNQIAGGHQSRGQVVESFFNSREFQGTIAPVARLYSAYFVRMPDYGGLVFWAQYYRTNSLLAISNHFATSPEFFDRYGSLGSADFVALVYNNVLGRAYDPVGQAFWTGEPDSGRMTRGQVMLEFSESPEYQSLVRSEVYSTMMYIGMLRRAPDPGGFSFWVDYLDQGNSGLALIDGFLGSPEYRARFLP